MIKQKKFLYLLIAFLMMMTSVTVLANEEAEIYPPSYAFEDYWYIQTASFGDRLPVRAALLMEAQSGKILYAQDENGKFPIASVTKVMSTLLVMEAIDGGRIKLEDKVTVGEAAAKMGGSQVYLEQGEQMTVDELLKAMIVVSANDATVAFAEHLGGSEQSFVTMMNERAKELGMDNTHFVNCHGLNEDNHYSTAYDVALMTKELLKHDLVFNYTGIWMDTIRNGSFGLANTNKLIRFYNGANGMKTGFTGVAKYCISATAKRDGMQLIAVIIGAETGDIRFASATKLLDFGFANYKICVPEKQEIGYVNVANGSKGRVKADYTPPSILADKSNSIKIESTLTVNDVAAPVSKGDILGCVDYFIKNEKIATVPVVAAESDKKITFFDIFGNILKTVFSFI